MSKYLGRRPTDPDYGLGEHTIDCDTLGIASEREWAEKLIRTFESPSYRPPRLPAVATELLALSQQPEVEFHAIQSVLEQDAILAGEVLASARSTFYASTVPVDSLNAALVRLGISRLREIVFQAAMNLRVFRSVGYRDCMERVRLHCQATAHLSRIISTNTRMAGERAFLFGLLHDVGIAGILLVLGDTERGKKAPDLSGLWPAIDATHAKVGARMVKLWDLPPEIATAVEAHHQVCVDGRDDPFAATVCLAEALASDLDLAILPHAPGPSASNSLDGSGPLRHARIDRSDDATLERARNVLKIDAPMVHVIRKAARAWADSVAVTGAPRRR